MDTTFETRLFINGEFVDAKTSQRMSCYNPADGSLVTDDVHVAVKEDVDAAVTAARAAFPIWAAKPPAERAEILLKWADLIEKHGPTIATLETLTSGKPKTIAVFGEIMMAARHLRYNAGWCDKLVGDTMPASEGFLRIVTHEPLGVCAAICPFNAAIVLAASKAGPALAAGNTIIIKTSEKTPLSTLSLGRLANEAGMPPGVVNILSGPGSTGALLASHLDVDKVSFTGSSATGRKVVELAAKSNMKRVGLELGGKSPAIIFPDANLDIAVQWCVRAITGLTGQMCIANSRVYVHKLIKDEFLSRFEAGLKASEATIGDPTMDTTMIGPLVDKLQFDRVMSFIEHGKTEAKLLRGGGSIGEKGCFVQPTVFIDAGKDSKVLREEIFGPVVVVCDFETEEDVITQANDTPYGLSASVFSQDINRALRVASKIHSGTVCVNCSVQNNVEVPFGGVKQSGWGRENGKDGILAYTEPKTTFVNLGY